MTHKVGTTKLKKPIFSTKRKSQKTQKYTKFIFSKHIPNYQKKKKKKTQIYLTITLSRRQYPCLSLHDHSSYLPQSNRLTESLVSLTLPFSLCLLFFFFLGTVLSYTVEWRFGWMNRTTVIVNGWVLSQKVTGMNDRKLLWLKNYIWMNGWCLVYLCCGYIII